MSKSSKRRAGVRRIRLQVNEEFYAFARAMANRHGYFGADDYLNALLNTSILTEMDEQDWPVERGGSSAAGLEDLDDGIPF